MTRRYVSKPGKHGTLYLYEVRYRADDGSPIFTWRTWAYDAEHASERWHDSDDDGWIIEDGPTRVRERA